MKNLEYKRWLEEASLLPTEREELLAIADNEGEIAERFHSPLSFGTAGIRGIMGVGLHRMNTYVIRQVTQAFAKVILAEGDPKKGVVIAYDCRHNSALFAKEAACVMAANGIFVRIFPAMRPTPQLSFAIRHFGAQAGINLTASHNPKEYSGYKVYWSDGAQMPTQFASEIARQKEQVDIFDDIKHIPFDQGLAQGMISVLDEDIDELFLQAVLNCAISDEALQQQTEALKIVYTPFHGAGRVAVPEALRRAGFKHIYPVAEQMIPDGDFSTVKSPNPEDPEGFYLALALAKKEGAQLIIGTDPDADRVGAFVLHQGEYRMISGNQMGVLLLGFLIAAKTKNKTMPPNPVFIQSIVTTEMSINLARHHGLAVYEVFTGFKHMAEKIAQLEDGQNTLFSYEESYGYMIEDFVRDKDAVTASMLIAQMVAWYQARGLTLFDALEEHYKTLGSYYGEETLNLMMPGLDGASKMAVLMESMRENPPLEIAGQAVISVRDYLGGFETRGQTREEIPLKGSNVLEFRLADGTKVLARPSGTEPKMKVYVLAQGESPEALDKTLKQVFQYVQQWGR